VEVERDPHLPVVEVLMLPEIKVELLDLEDEDEEFIRGSEEEQDVVSEYNIKMEGEEVKMVQSHHEIQQESENYDDLTFDPEPVQGSDQASESDADWTAANNSQNGLTCQDCGKRGFSSKQALRHHTRQVHNPLRFHCPECDKHFKTKYQVIRHCLLIHKKDIQAYPDLQAKLPTAPRPSFKFTCQVCGSGFNTKKGLSSHVYIVHNPQRHTCPECGNRFKTMCGLKKHLVDIHKKDPSHSLPQEPRQKKKKAN